MDNIPMGQPKLIDIRRRDTFVEAQARDLLFSLFPDMEPEIDAMHGASCLELVRNMRLQVTKES